jgi:hypothetical protein
MAPVTDTALDDRGDWPSRASRLIEENVDGFLLDMGTTGGGSLRDDDLVTWTVGGSPIGYHNAVVRCSARGGDSGLVVEEWLDELRRRNLPGCWHWIPAMDPDLPQLLVAAGVTVAGEEPAMAADLANLAPASDPPVGFEMTRIEDAAGLDAYRSVLADGFGEGPKEADWVAKIYRGIGLGDDVPWRHYVCFLDGEPTSAATLYLTDEAAGLYS